MKRYFTKKAITAFAFVGLLFFISLLNLGATYPSLKSDIMKFWNSTGKNKQSLSTLVTSLNNTITDQAYHKYAFIETYGYLQKLLGKNEINNFEVVKDKQGYLYYTYFTTGPNDIQVIADRMSRLNQSVSKTGAKVMYMMTPDKYIKGKTQFESGIPYNYANETADHFLSALQKDGVDTLDFRQLMKKDGNYTIDSFYKTDHHWTVQTAFWAFTQLANVLDEKYHFQFPNKELYTNLKNYNQVVYKDAFLGSMGEKEGILYSGAEDFTFIYPKFSTNYNFYAQTGTHEENLSGAFENTIAFDSILEGKGNIYDAQSDKYFTYMAGNPGFVEITNNNEPQGPTVLFIKDSLIVPTAAFFSLGCSKVYMIDPRYYTGNIEKFLADYKFDYVFVSFSPENLTTQFFPFYTSGN